MPSNGSPPCVPTCLTKPSKWSDTTAFTATHAGAGIHKLVLNATFHMIAAIERIPMWIREENTYLIMSDSNHKEKPQESECLSNF